VLSFPYFSERYFSPYYFGALGLQSPSGGISPSTPSDSSGCGPIEIAFANLVEIIDSLWYFASVSLGSPSDLQGYGSGGTPYVIVMPQSWVDEDQVDPEMIVRTVNYEIFVCVNEVNERSRFEKLEEFCGAISSVIRGSALGGVCLPFLTRVTQAKFAVDSVYPKKSGILIGSFSLLLETSATSHRFFYAS
jgi:hypothetical protein